MPTRAFVIKFPDADFEYDFTRGTVLAVGQTLRRRGALWSVTGIDGEDVATVYVEPADHTSQSPHPLQPAGDDRSL